jgi:hypothetical protein
MPAGDQPARVAFSVFPSACPWLVRPGAGRKVSDRPPSRGIEPLWGGIYELHPEKFRGLAIGLELAAPVPANFNATRTGDYDHPVVVVSAVLV